MKITTSAQLFVLGIRHSCKQNQISRFVPNIMQKSIGQALAEGLTPQSGINITLAFDRESAEVSFFAGVVTNKPGQGNNEVETLNIESKNSIVAEHLGDYARIPDIFREIQGFAAINNLKLGKHPYYLYLNNPMEVESETELRTRVVWALE